MKNTQMQVQPSFFARNKTPLLIGGGLFVVGGIVLTYFLLQKKEKKEEVKMVEQGASLPSSTAAFTPPYVPSSNTRNTTPIQTSSGKVLIKYGSRGSLVRVLQRYLKLFNEDLGRSGSKRDGVDGIFGRKTAKAAKKRLGKTVFKNTDIEKMKNALKTLGK